MVHLANSKINTLYKDYIKLLATSHWKDPVDEIGRIVKGQV